MNIYICIYIYIGRGRRTALRWLAPSDRLRVALRQHRGHHTLRPLTLWRGNLARGIGGQDLGAPTPLG